MKILLTADEIMERGWWQEYCEITGTSEWAVNEGQIDSKEELELPKLLILRHLSDKEPL